LALVIEPDEGLRRLVREALREDGWRVVEACSADEALTVISRQQSWPLVYCSDNLPQGGAEACVGSGILETLRKYLGAASYIVMVGASDSSNAALDAIIAGASDFISLPCRADDVRKLARVVKQRLLAADRETTEYALEVHPDATTSSTRELNLVGASEAVVNVFKKIARSLTSRTITAGNNGVEKGTGKRSPSYFITGETGTGKELVAHLIHQRSMYAVGPFVPVNCSTLPTDLAESELFGHEPGAFTGAVREKKGLWELANGGTLFLDEITEAPQAVLPKFLRVLQDSMVRRLGSNRWIPVDVQVVAASNRDLRSEIKAGRFREDLYHRLSLFQFHLPPLRERRGDIPLLVTHFARHYATHPIKLSQDALELLIQHSWPGNVRELENVVRAAISHAADGMIYAVDLLPHLQGVSEIKATCSVCSGVTASASEVTVTASPTSFDAQVKEFKLKTVKEALRQHRGNITHTAAALGITRPTLYKLLKELESGN
ncbi:MAG: sigma-54-dependent transcriptional regulator, partial [Pyrinomonadaceae bacterium]